MRTEAPAAPPPGPYRWFRHRLLVTEALDNKDNWLVVIGFAFADTTADWPKTSSLHVVCRDVSGNWLDEFLLWSISALAVGIDFAHLAEFHLKRRMLVPPLGSLSYVTGPANTSCWFSLVETTLLEDAVRIL